MNITFLTIDGSEICLDGTKPIVTQKPRYSTDTVEAKRFRPKLIGNSTSFLSNILEFITDPDWKSQYDAEDRCFRFNGELISAPQNKKEEEMVDKLLWDYMMKKAANNVSYIIENSKQMKTFTSTITRPIDIGDMSDSYDPRQMTFPPQGKQDLIHSLTGESLKRHREGYIYPQQITFYKFPQVTVLCWSSIKKMTESHTWRLNFDPFCNTFMRQEKTRTNYICRFEKEPFFTVRGLCKEAPMDTQYMLEDHKPGEFGYGKDSRGFVGPKGWIISKNLTDKKWRMTHYHYTDLTVTMLDSDSLPIGRHKWLVENNVCNEGKTSAMVLQISGCEEGHFTCDDGKCISIDQRCNNIEVFLNICFLNSFPLFTL